MYHSKNRSSKKSKVADKSFAEIEKNEVRAIEMFKENQKW